MTITSNEISEQEADQILTEIVGLAKRAIFSKASTVALMYLVALLIAGVGPLKSLVVAIAAAALLYKAVAPTLVLHGGVTFFILTLIDWTQLLPLAKWAHALVTIIDRALILS
jgi:hypothetical protein